MIVFITHDEFAYTLDGLLAVQPRPRGIEIRSYDWLLRQRGMRAATVIFTDQDRLRHEELVRAGRLSVEMEAAGIRVLNRPSRVMQRYELHRALHRAGLNPYRVYRAEDAPRPERFPVILKAETAHLDTHGGLIHDQSELDAAIERERAAGVAMRYILVAEFANEPIRPNVWQRNTIWRVADRVFAGTSVIEDRPVVKAGTMGLSNDADFERVLNLYNNNPHLEDMRRIFEFANIDYGRADYGHYQGRIAVYEINLNPTVPRLAASRNPDVVAAQLGTAVKVVEAVGSLQGPDREVQFSREARRNLYARRYTGLRMVYDKLRSPMRAKGL